MLTPPPLVAMKETTTRGNKLLDGPQLLVELFPPEARPSLRWLRTQTKQRNIPFIRCGGRLVFFDPEAVRSHLLQNFTVEARQ